MYICKRINKALYDMKRFNISILFAVLLLCVSAVKGQSVVSDVLNHSSDTTIVRYWKEDINIVYTCISEFQDKYFLLVDETSPIVYRIAVPQGMTVNDFRILHDMVYVGGHHVDGTGYQRGLLACFDIQDFYSGVGTYHWMVMQLTVMPDCYGGGCYNQVCDVVRLAVYDDELGKEKIAYIGKNYVMGEPYLRVGIGCAQYFPGTGGWQNIIIYKEYGGGIYRYYYHAELCCSGGEGYSSCTACTIGGANLSENQFSNTDLVSSLWGIWGMGYLLYYGRSDVYGFDGGE